MWRDEKMITKRIDQITVIPKNPLCGHFDGYDHTLGGEFPISKELFPPLFIPNGFFENKIKIRYGYEDYKEGWININPLKEKYIFKDKNGTDLKISIENIPLFWKEKISKIDINPKLDKKILKEKIKDLNLKMREPHELIEDKKFLYRFKLKIISGNYIPYWLKRFFRKNSIIRNLRIKIFFKLRKDFLSSVKND
jgi:hypothetical protein